MELQYSNKEVLAQKQSYGTMEKNRDPRIKPTHYGQFIFHNGSKNILGWPQIAFRFFCRCYEKTFKGTFGQPNKRGRLPRWLSGKESACQRRRPGFDSPGWEDSPEKAMATNSSIPAWGIPWTEEPCGLQGRKESDITEWLNNNNITRVRRQSHGKLYWASHRAMCQSLQLEPTCTPLGKK